jgi:predicted nucleotidyltransferase
MKRDEAIKLLRETAGKLHELGVAHACLFGSVARDEAEEGSDVDVFTLGGLNNALPSVQQRINSEIADAF